MKATKHYFPYDTVYSTKVVLTFEFVDEIRKVCPIK